MGNLERLLEQVSADKESRRYGQQSLFGEDNGELPRYALEAHGPWPQSEVLAHGKGSARHVLFRPSARRLPRGRQAQGSGPRSPTSAAWAREGGKGERKVTVIGVVGEVREIQTRGGRQMAFAALEDMSGSAELVIFADPFSASRELLEGGAVVAATGTVDRSRGEPKVLVDTLSDPHQLPDRTGRAAAADRAGRGKRTARTAGTARTLHLRLDSAVSDDRLIESCASAALRNAGRPGTVHPLHGRRPRVGDQGESLSCG